MKQRTTHSLFFKLFLSIMAITLAILLVQTIVVGIMFNIQSRQFKHEVFESYRTRLHEVLEESPPEQWNLNNVAPLLKRILDDRVSGLVLRNTEGDVILVYGKAPRGGVLPESGAQDIVGTIPLYGGFSESNAIGTLDVLVFSPMDYALTAILLRRMLLAFAVTIPLALLIALAGSRVVAKSVSRHASRIARSLESIAGGDYRQTILRSTMTELEQIAEAVEQLEQQLENHERMRRQWLGSIAHDLNTPVTALKLSVEGALDKVMPMDEAALQRMRKEVGELERRVSAVMLLNSMEAPEFQLNHEAIDVLDFTDEVLGTLTIDHRIKLGIETDTIIADGRLMLMVARELIYNACKYGEEGTVVEWNIRKDADAVTVMEFQNKGTISQEILERAFEPWYRGDSSRSRPGSGLGLSLVRQTMDAHQGNATMTKSEDSVKVTLKWPIKGSV
jgi:signal transduction histidine kinase